MQKTSRNLEIKIGIDARTLNVKGGSKTYASNLLHNIKDRENIILFGVDKFEDYKCVPEKTNQQNPFFRLYYEKFKLPKLLKDYKIDVFHGLKGVAPKINSVKIIITVHDLYVFKYPQYANFKDLIYWRYFSPKYIKKADKIIAVSYATKKDLIDYLKINPNKISVIWESYNNRIYKINNNTTKTISFFREKNIDIKDKSIILNVNTISPRKNIQRIIQSFNEVAPDRPDTILLVVGRDGWKTRRIYKEYNKSPFKDRIYFIGFVPDEVIADLYNMASVFVYSSFYEGFGLPVLEAQACGCPVITSNVSSMPEVAGEAGILVDPNNVSSISEAISAVVDDNNYRKELITKGFNNIKIFSWEKCAEETKKIYKEVMG